ncbi:MAG: substrate-binding domain-containing protein [Ruminococcus sp.]|nr:substrate-binding domain-containing protein [Candidatus Copronaster equi]
MKKIISVLLVFSLLVCSFSGCSTKKKSNVKIGLAAPAATHGWVAGVAYYAEKYCRKNGIDYKLTISSDAPEMEKNLNNLVDWGADTIVVWPQWKGMEDAVEKVIKKDIPVISFDVDINCDGIHKITGNNYEMGYECAKYIMDKNGKNSIIAVLEVPSAGSVSDQRKKGFYDYLDEIGYDTNLLFDVAEKSFSREDGYNDMKKILSEHKDIDAVFSMDDEISIGVVKAITESGRKDIKAVTGGGGMQEYFRMIADEKYASLGLCSALYSPSMIEDAIKTAIDTCTGENSSRVIIIPTTIVNSENVEKYIDSKNTVY